MKGSTKHSSKATRRTVLVLYVILYLISTTTISLIQVSLNATQEYSLSIQYEVYTTTITDDELDYDYTTVTIDTPITISNFKRALIGISVGGFPLWVDTSGWADGSYETIDGIEYSISVEGNRWKAHRSISSSNYEDLYYHRVTGIFLESYSHFITLESGGNNGYSMDILIQQSNIDGFASKLTGRNIVVNILLISAIFVEVLLIRWIWERKHESLL